MNAALNSRENKQMSIRYYCELRFMRVIEYYEYQTKCIVFVKTKIFIFFS